MKRKLLLALLSLSLTFFLPSIKTASAQEQTPAIDIGRELINPGSVLFPIKRLSEKTQLLVFSKIGPSKENPFILKLLRRRFRELYYVFESNDLENFEKVAIRYNTTIGLIIDKNIDLSPENTDKYDAYFQILSRMKDTYEYGSSYWLLTQQAIELTQQMLSK